MAQGSTPCLDEDLIVSILGNVYFVDFDSIGNL